MGKDSYSDRLEIHKSGLSQKRLDIELTERCNNNCIHCYINLPADDHRAAEKELSTEEVKKILEEAAALGYMTVRFTGGEPLLREDFEELYLYARRLGLKVIIFTNATFITPHLVELFARIPPLERMEITVYGMKKKTYEAVTRTPGSFEAAWQGINLLLEAEVPFLVKGAFLPPNRGEIDEFETWASTIPWMDKAPSYSIAFDLRGRHDSEKKNRLIKGIRSSPEEVFKFLIKRDEKKYTENMKEFCSRAMNTPTDKLFTCGAGRKGCVDAYGHFQPCMLLRHPHVVYDLKNGSLEEALTNFFPEMRRMKASNPAYLERCARCFLKGLLCEWCPGKSWMEHGTLDTPIDYLCETAHLQANHLGLLKDGEMAWEVSDWKERIKELSHEKPAVKENE